MGGRRPWVRIALGLVIAAAVLAGGGLARLVQTQFTYYDNGTWVHTNLLAVYAKSLSGYGRAPIKARRLGADWGSWPHYAARNFTANLAGIDYPTSRFWEDYVGPSALQVMKQGGSGWAILASYPAGPRLLPGQTTTAKVYMNGRGADDKVYYLTLSRPRFSYVAYATAVKDITPPVGPSRPAISITDPEGAESTVRRYLLAERDNDYDTWESTLIKEKQDAFTPQTNGEFGVISLTVNRIQVSTQKTARCRQMYSGSDLAKHRGWSDEYIAENLVAVYAEFSVQYDGKKVPYNSGTLERYFYLVRDDRDSPWLIWDASTDTSTPP